MRIVAVVLGRYFRRGYLDSGDRFLKLDPDKESPWGAAAEQHVCLHDHNSKCNVTGTWAAAVNG